MRKAIFIFALMLLTANGFADNTKAAPPASAPATAKAELVPYVLAAEDVINIAVINFPNLSTQIVVPPDGKITVPLLEPINVTGKTTTELTQSLTEQWRKFVVNPSVTVTLTQKRRENVLFYGFVGKVGTQEYRPSLHIVEALAEAGGVNPSSDLTKVTVTRKTGEKQVLDLSHPEVKGGTEADILLQPGDVVYVPEHRTQITVVGEVNRPGSLEYKEDMTVLDALGAVGGVRETADLATATLMHDGKEKPLDLDALLRKGDTSINTKLTAGDRILIPEIRNRTYVFGAVGRPGYYIFKPGDRVLDALNGSGGPMREANLARVNVIRIDKAKNTAVVEAVDIEKFLKKGDLKGNVALSPGDVLFVPDKKHAFQIGDLFGMLTGLNVMGSTMRLLSGRPY